MRFSLHTLSTLVDNKALVVLLNSSDDASSYCSSEEEWQYVNEKVKHNQEIITINKYSRHVFFIAPSGKSGFARQEDYRRKGYQLASLIKAEKVTHLQVTGNSVESNPFLAFCEGFLLSQYQFLKYKKPDDNPYVFQDLGIFHNQITAKDVEELEHIVAGTFLARDLVNEPVISLNAEHLSKVIRETGVKSGFGVEVLEKDKIKALKMGGLLAVNAGSIDPPTFNVLEYKPENAINERPYVLVGKGVTYDTGGLSLKPTTSMDTMKSDMGGGAAVTGALSAIAGNRLPVYVIGLIPATDNRPGGNAMVPGDVITMADGTTVEVLNTDAEGRLILADALSYAKRYQPELVIDLATLTGAAVMAIGKEGLVMMGTAAEDIKNALKTAGNDVYERLVEFPLWDEYKEYLNSEIADLKNVGGRDAGAITAGIFLQHFTGYPWIHLDIAGSAFLSAPSHYKGKNGTGAGVRILYQFFKNLINQHE